MENEIIKKLIDNGYETLAKELIANGFFDKPISKGRANKARCCRVVPWTKELKKEIDDALEKAKAILVQEGVIDPPDAELVLHQTLNLAP